MLRYDGFPKNIHVKKKLMYEGFEAIIHYCKSLQCLSLSGMLTNKAFQLIGTYGKCLEMLKVAFVGDSNIGMQCVLSCCTNISKFEIRDGPFSDLDIL